MEQFELSVSGFGKDLFGVVTFGGQEIASFETSSLKDAERKARTAALRFQAENSPLPFTSVTQTFTV